MKTGKRSTPKISNLFYSIFSFFTALFFVLLGTVCISLPWLPNVRFDLVHFFLEGSLAIVLTGTILIIAGLAVLAYMFLGRRRHYTIRSTQGMVAVSEKVVNEYLSAYLNALFPEREAAHELRIQKRKLIISAELPSVSESEQEPLIRRMNREIAEILEEKLGYTEAYQLSVTFKR